ncbi:Smr/MutS family protein [Phaeodactylibacter luteus]|uniref:Smr domain-containing protein n=1 Tax=Phaeodactylibacter luteus TaxID=1564516 RepID=A0A5C6RK08_9BACT|nr:Smr/MutS family protein [Phaeodactylibacter luteus]TXB62766.1 hypothetical protein FRY97_12450 [Phaeodactylibacter luteus]
MLFSIGTRVKFVHSKDEGVVTALLDNGMVSVKLDEDGFEIPAFLDDIARIDSPLSPPSPTKAKIVPGKKPKIPLPPERPAAESQYLILKSQGLLLAFDPVANLLGQIDAYEMSLINDTRQDFLFSIEIRLGQRLHLRENHKIDRTSVYPLAPALAFGDLNDAPTVYLSCWPLTTQGTGKELAQETRIKPKQFFKRTRTAPLLNKQVHLFTLMDSKLLSGKQEQPPAEDLRDYTLKNKRPSHSQKPQGRGRLRHEVLELASFVPEIDLHIEHLTDNHAKLSNAEILRLQIYHFEQYLYKAIRLGVDRVFIIHGVGKGRLRDAIATRLLQMPDVQSFKNEYHPRYGYGATEVIL